MQRVTLVTAAVCGMQGTAAARFTPLCQTACGSFTEQLHKVTHILLSVRSVPPAVSLSILNWAPNSGNTVRSERSYPLVTLQATPKDTEQEGNKLIHNSLNLTIRGQALWYARSSCHLQNQHPIWAPFKSRLLHLVLRILHPHGRPGWRARLWVLPQVSFDCCSNLRSEPTGGRYLSSFLVCLFFLCHLSLFLSTLSLFVALSNKRITLRENRKI